MITSDNQYALPKMAISFWWMVPALVDMYMAFVRKETNKSVVLVGDDIQLGP